LDIYISMTDAYMPFFELAVNNESGEVIIDELVVKGLDGFRNAEIASLIELARVHKSRKLVLATSSISPGVIYNNSESCKLV
ncbi:hypothetical protein PMAYCL1PPCAC_26189, partial [Pristionchus mayeri]